MSGPVFTALKLWKSLIIMRNSKTMDKQNQYFPQSVPHPGETLEEKLEELGIGPKEFALRTQKPEKTIAAVLNGTSSITPDMAILFEAATRIPSNFWLRRQLQYDEYLARKKREAIIDESGAWAKKFPVADMMKKGWLSPSKTLREKTIELLTFFGIADQTAWEEYYLHQQLKVAFRISLAHTSDPYAISAWLRKGDLQAAALTAEPYIEKNFKESLPAIKSLMARHPKDFFQQLQQLCLKAGVKVVHTPCLSKAPINGGTRWIHDTPMIQLTGRYKRNDIFWFTFFHEAGHIFLHGKKDIFLEDVEYSDKDMAKEKEADAFAVKWTLSIEEENEILELPKLTEKDIIEFAHQFNTHPGVIMGRLRHKKLHTYLKANHFFEQVDLD